MKQVPSRHNLPFPLLHPSSPDSILQLSSLSQAKAGLCLRLDSLNPIFPPLFCVQRARVTFPSAFNFPCNPFKAVLGAREPFGAR